MRLDKFLKVSRLIKRRTVANTVSEMGRVLVNGNPAKPAKQLKVGDIIEIGFGEKTVRAEVLAVAETVRKENAAELFRYIG
jgi:ribosomal 50S subunit-recycling heat shock protein